MQPEYNQGATSSIPRIQRGDNTWRKQLGNPKCGTHKRTGLDSAKVNVVRENIVKRIVLELKKYTSNALILIKSF